ncbi:hypothetical protein QQF64_008689 [Cirrhinus molitorella]|uniref:Uncharacterized protein n=1 Tax=Cirrhinus molitorella TaxID=172907 RepID=A0ABR3MAB8_9TELE
MYVFCRHFPLIVHSGGAEEREKHLISVDNRRVALQDRVVSIFSALRCSERNGFGCGILSCQRFQTWERTSGSTLKD